MKKAGSGLGNVLELILQRKEKSSENEDLQALGPPSGYGCSMHLHNLHTPRNIFGLYVSAILNVKGQLRGVVTCSVCRILLPLVC